MPVEIASCNRFLREELKQMERVRVVIALGKIAFDTYLKTRSISPRPAFKHNWVYELSPALIASFHPSRQNTNTGKLTEPMFDKVFSRARELLG